MKTSRIASFLFSSALSIAGLAVVNVAHAAPYASAVTNNAGSVSFFLNENADSVKIMFNNRTVTNDLGALSKGSNSFSLGAYTNFQIFVTKTNTGAGFISANGSVNTNSIFGVTNNVAAALQISSDTNAFLTFNQPRGLTVNRDPKSAYFGRIYVANAMAGTTTVTGATRGVGDGIYMLNPDQTDALGRGTNASTGGLNFTTGGTNATPWRITIGTDNNLYICDWSDSTGNLYMTDPDVSPTSGTNVLKALTGSAVTPVGANNNHGSITAAYVEGSLAKTNLTVYTIDEDLQSTKTTTNITMLNSLWKYAVNGSALPYGSDPTKIWSSTAVGKDGYPLTSQVLDLDRGSDGKFYTCTYRINGTESGVTILSSTGTTNFVSYKYSTNSGWTIDLFNNSYALTVAPNQRYLAVMKRSGTTWILPLTNGFPDVSKRLWLNTFTSGSAWATRFDAAGNLYVVDANSASGAAGTGSGPQLVRIFSPGGTTTAVTGNDTTGTNGSFNLYESPLITAQPQGVTNFAGTNVSFVVEAGGPASVLNYQWYFNDAPISGQTTNSLIRTNVQVNTLAGYYKCVISNQFFPAVTSAVVSLVVTDGPPVITVQPVASVTVGAGSNATAFAVTTLGTDTRFYQWQLNGTNIMGATASSLTRNNVQQPIAGDYQVIISNVYGAVTSSPTTLSVSDIAPVVTTQPVSKTVAAGTNVTFTVTSTGGTDPRVYTWMVNGTPIAGATTSSLTVTNVQTTDSGNTYSVSIANTQGTFTSSNAVLTVTDTPNATYITQPASVTVGAGQNATFTASAYGNGPINYQWYLNGNAISGATSTSLVWTNSQTSDSGSVFSVSISNGTSGPTSSANATLTVTNRVPTITVQPASTSANVGDTASFTVTAQGQSPISYQWMLGTNSIAGQTGSTLTLSNVQLSNAATNYNVVVSTSAGSVTSSAAQLAVVVSSTTGTGTGVTGEYWANHYIGDIPNTNGYISITDTPTVSRIEPNIDFNWGSTNSPDTNTIPLDYFFARWTGRVQPLYSQDYTFSTLSDDGIRFWFDGKLLIDQWKSGGSQNFSVTVSNLVAGQTYDIRVEYVEITGNAEAHLYWSSASQVKSPVPTSQLYPDSGPYVVAVTPTNAVMNAGDTSTTVFTATAGGLQPLTYQWQHNGSNIPNATSSALELDNAQVSDAGSYTVVVGNSIGVRTSTVPLSLTVVAPSTPGSGTGILGEYFSKAVQTSAWYTNVPSYTNIDAAIDFNWGTASVNSSVSAETNVVRWTGQIQPLYSQVYTFQTLSDEGVRLWVDGQLIIDKWVVGTTNVNNYTATLGYPFVAGQNYDIRLEYFEKTGPSEVHLWWWSGSQVKQIIPTAQLFPQTGPYFITQPADQNGVFGSNFTFTVYAGGSGTVAYQWRKNGSNIGGATNSVLTLNSLQVSDAAAYSVNISNTITNRTSTNGTLTVNFAPSISQQPLDATANVGDNVTFSVTASGSGTLNYQWQFNGNNISSATNSSYNIASVVATNQGTFDVVVSSAFGSVTSSNAALTVHSSAPTPTISSASVSGGNVGFSFTTAVGFNYKVQFTSDLSQPWTDVEVIVGTGSGVSRSYGVGSGKGFYRIVAY